ncbi:hypothetical protein EVAR_48390_1 [Eumeta japonica]|uniref:Protein kinase domain-containing protein n=1 Tax=Eumeta variegata TaxID=151549 RepID=A0A4C1ZD27_EUMVA|nr:hypothetical protein EVAR_48390_1 [Eumeta japonica]
MQHGPRLYVVMEAATGGDLSALVLAARGARASGGLPERRARALAAQLVSAVRHMHERGVVHRDLKMENIMLDGAKQFIKIVGKKKCDKSCERKNCDVNGPNSVSVRVERNDFDVKDEPRSGRPADYG